MNNSPDTPPKVKKRGCLFYGGTGCLGILLLIGLGCAYSVWSITKRFRPMNIDPVVLSSTEKQVWEQKVETLKRGKSGIAMRGKSTSPSSSQSGDVTITSREISSLLSGQEFGNSVFSISFQDDRIQIAANIPVPPDITQSLNLQLGSFQSIASMFVSTEVVPVNASARINLKDGKVFLQLLSADLMGLPLSAVAGSTWDGWQELDIVNAFGDQAPVLKSVLGSLNSLQFDNQGLHLSPR